MSKKKKKSIDKPQENIAQPVEMCNNTSNDAVDVADCAPKSETVAEKIPQVPANPRPAKVFPHW